MAAPLTLGRCQWAKAPLQVGDAICRAPLPWRQDAPPALALALASRRVAWLHDAGGCRRRAAGGPQDADVVVSLVSGLALDRTGPTPTRHGSCSTLGTLGTLGRRAPCRPCYLIQCWSLPLSGGGAGRGGRGGGVQRSLQVRDPCHLSADQSVSAFWYSSWCPGPKHGQHASRPGRWGEGGGGRSAR